LAGMGAKITTALPASLVVFLPRRRGSLFLRLGKIVSQPSLWKMQL